MKSLIHKFFLSLGLDIKFVKEPNYNWLKNRNLKAVLDIGANTGQFANFINKVLPGVKIYSFEPIESCYNQLIANTQGVNLTPFKLALGNEEGKSKINVSKHSPSSSLLKMANLHTTVFKNTDFSHQEEITISTLDGVFSDKQIPTPYLVKIDVQGFEDKVIAGGSKVISNADLIIIETSFKTLYESQLLFSEIFKLLESLGFEFIGNLSQTKDPRDGSFLYAESIFVKKKSNK